MSYKQLIGKSVTLAFKFLKDLAIPATFGRPEVTSFDFQTGRPTEATMVAVEAKVVVGKVKKTDQVETLQIIMDTKLVDPLFTKVTLEGSTWTIVKVIVSNQYTTLLELSRTL